jgi:hypothetical protein
VIAPRSTYGCAARWATSFRCRAWLLGKFITYLEHASATTVTIDAAVAWATLPAGDLL